MEAQAKLNKLRISPRKTRLVADSIRSKKVLQALRILSQEPKKAALPIKKLLQSAVANWYQKQPQEKQEQQENEIPLYIKEIHVGSAGMLKRIKPAAKGTAHQIRKRSAHITLVVAKHVAEPTTTPTPEKK